MNPELANVVVYTRPGCHLCEDACQTLRTHGFRPRMVNIDSDADLRERFDTIIPVVEINGEIRFRGRLNEMLLQRLLKGNSG